MSIEFSLLVKEQSTRHIILLALINDLNEYNFHIETFFEGAPLTPLAMKSLDEIIMSYNKVVEVHNSLCEEFNHPRRAMIDQQMIQAKIRRMTPVSLKVISS